MELSVLKQLQNWNKGGEVLSVSKLLQVAEKEIGVKEYPKNSNNVKYNTEYYGREVSGDNYRWCMVFIWWCFKEVNMSDAFYGGKKCASCTTVRDFHKDKVITSGYKPGDIIFYNFNKGKLDPLSSTCQHAGFCKEWHPMSGKMHSIEGNTGTTNDANGGSVMCRIRTQDQIVCGIRLVGEINQVKYQQVTLPILKSGYNMPAVKSAQTLLNYLGYDCGVADGIFGTKTDAAVRKFQTENALYPDGQIGKDTYKKFFKE